MSLVSRLLRGSNRLVCLLACFGASIATDAADEQAAARRIEADVHFLADDLLEGRETGTRGHELAALYVANRFRAIGLEPAGDHGSYFQAVRMLSGVRDPEGALLRIERNGTRRELRFQDEFLPAVNFTAGEVELSAPLVFVGHGVRAPELGHDDLAGIDVRGKIAVLFTNAPARFPNDQRAFHSDSNEKYRELERLGAVGVISIYDPVTEKSFSWARSAQAWQHSSMRGLDAAGKPIDDFPGLAVRASCSTRAAEALFAGSAHPLAEILTAFERGELRSFDLPGTATIATRASLTPVQSPNVVARLPGGDPALAREHIVFTAHLDHLGIGVPHAGDAIYNGALDNALGVAAMIEAAHLLAAEVPARSMLFIATTAEEKGLLGAQHFASMPTVPADSLVAEINMDMPMAFGDLTDVIPIGIEHSSLQAVAERAVAEAGLRMTPDPYPAEVLFVRSDQYPLVRAGVPAVNLDASIRPRDGSDGLARQRRFFAERYHLPDDEIDDSINWAYAVRLAQINYRIGMTIANDPQRPRWNPGDFFGERFGRARGPSAQTTAH